MSNDATDNSRAEMLLSLASLLSTAAVIETCLAGLEGKRVTLEEKMIKTYSNDLIAAIADYVARTQKIISGHAFDIDAEALKAVVLLAADMQPVFSDLQKTIEYDWNFLEQYYEHAFYGKLTNEHRFKERLHELQICVVEKTTTSKDQS
jgi:hypothetical protein